MPIIGDVFCFIHLLLAGLADWHAQQWELHQSANKKEGESFDLRYTAKSLISETTIKTEWNNHMNNHRLSDRFDRYILIVTIYLSKITFFIMYDYKNKKIRVLYTEGKIVFQNNRIDPLA